jgi:hypothetical protein
MSTRLAALALALVAGCGLGHTDEPSGGDGGSSGGGSGGSSGGGSSGGGSSPCPASAPAGGTPCTTLGLTCEYGTDPDRACNTVAACAHSGAWSVTAAEPAPACPTPAHSGSCPATYGAVPVGSACASTDLACAYPEGRCECLVPLSGPPHVGGGSFWACDQPGAGCPQPRPRLGSPCTAPASAACDYGGCSLPNGVSLVCQQGVWTEGPKACPL